MNQINAIDHINTHLDKIGKLIEPQYVISEHEMHGYAALKGASILHDYVYDEEIHQMPHTKNLRCI